MPDHLFEVSWEVCNKVGGIHTVIATKALTISKQLGRPLHPDRTRRAPRGCQPRIRGDPALLKEWKQVLFANHNIRVGPAGGKSKEAVDDPGRFQPVFLRAKGRCVEIPVGELPVDSISGQWIISSPCCSGRRPAR